MPIQNLNTNTYYRTVGTSSVSITLTGTDTAEFNRVNSDNNVILSNLGTFPVFAVAGLASAATAIYPTDSATATSIGTILPPGSVVTYALPETTKYISFIAQAGSNDVAISIGPGE